MAVKVASVPAVAVIAPEVAVKVALLAAVAVILSPDPDDVSVKSPWAVDKSRPVAPFLVSIVLVFVSPILRLPINALLNALSDAPI